VKLATAGERLFALIRKDVLADTAVKGVPWSDMEAYVEEVGGRWEFGAYVRGAISIHSMRRLLRYWGDERDLVASESQYVRRVTSFIRAEVFPGLGEHLAQRLARAVIEADRASNRKISPSVKKGVLGRNRQPTCYLCPQALDVAAPEGDPKHLTLEHLWPTSIGGDSIEANLLPACQKCQDVTKDSASWEWLNIHNFVLPADASGEALKAIHRKARFARHYFHALQLGDAHNLTLKEAFVKAGPMKATLTHVNTGLPLTFFDLQTN
jgi:5-methylcytosine-specific restriction endonuclease McrA